MVKREEIRATQEAWRAYLDLALGLTQTSRKQAIKAVRKLVGKGGATAEQLQSMAEDLVKTSLSSRESLIRLVRAELDRAVIRVGLATAEEVAELTDRVHDLEQRLRAAETNAATAATTATAASTRVETVAAGTSAPAAKKAAKAAPAPAAKKAARGAAAKKIAVRKTAAK
jgi:polyhydroxyalkanoate synthesis regulator phasin